MLAKNNIFSWVFPLALLICSFIVLPRDVSADPITINGQWYQFGFDPNHSPFAAGCLPADPSGVPCRTPDAGVNSIFLGPSPWTFSSSVPVQFTITDVFLSGDFFDLFDNGILVGSTPVVPGALQGGAICALNPDVCLANPKLSHAIFILPPGAHAITIRVHESQILGEGFFRATEVPEPSTLLLLGSGVLAILWRRRGSKA
jgi:hypothetical protein